MKKFQPGNNLYSKPYDGYTSSDEFIAKKRVHTTNEIPPVSIYKNLHSMLHNDFWKWLAGNTEIIYDEVYNLSTDGIETFDKSGNIENMSVAKYTNGIRSQNYGPLPRMVWNPKWRRDYKQYLSLVEEGFEQEGKKPEDFKWVVDNSETTYNRFEVTGVMEPEKDFILHEGYRYLSCVYPDHPDYLNILTKNEFDDKIDDAAKIIDYDIDTYFMDWLPSYLKYSDGTDLNIAREDESSKLKIRNLTNYAFNRKLFGSKEGYKMFAASVYQHASVYAASKYIPFENGSVEDVKPHSVDYSWYKEFFDKPEDFENSLIDKSHYLYKKLFRNIDWQNASYDFVNRYKKPTYFYGTAYPTPNSGFILYEYPNERVIDMLDKEEGRTSEDLFGTIRSDFKEGQKIKVGGQLKNWEEGSYKEGHISYILSGTYYKVKAKLYYNSKGNFNTSQSSLEESHIDNALTMIGIDIPMKPIYRDFDVYPSNKKILQAIYNHDNNNDLIEHDSKVKNTSQKWAINKGNKMVPYIKAISSDQPFYKSTLALEKIYDEEKEELSRYDSIQEVVNTKLTLDPHQDGCMYVSPVQQLSEFRDALNITLDTSVSPSEIIYRPTNLSENAILKQGDVIISKDKKYISTVLGISNAYLQFKIEDQGCEYEIINDLVERINDEETSKYGVILTLSKNNEKSGGKKVVILGKPTFENVTPVEGNKKRFTSKGVYFDVSAIPTVKSHSQMKLIYGNDFTSVANKKYQALCKLYDNNFDSIEDSNIKNSLENLKEIESKINSFEKDIVSTKRSITNKSIYYRTDTIDKFIASVNSLVGNFESRPIFKLKAQRDFSGLLDDLNTQSTNIMSDFRNTTRMYLMTKGNSSIENIYSYRKVYIDSLKDELTILSDLISEEYDHFYNVILKLNDSEVEKIKENLEKNYNSVSKKIASLNKKITKYSLKYNDDNWAAIKTSVLSLSDWFARAPESKDRIKIALNDFFDKCGDYTEDYYKNSLDTLNLFNKAFSKQYDDYISALSRVDNSEDEKTSVKNLFDVIANSFNKVESVISNKEVVIDDDLENLRKAYSNYSAYLIDSLTIYDISIKESADYESFKKDHDRFLDDFINLEESIFKLVENYTSDYTSWEIEEISISDEFYKNKIDTKNPNVDMANASIDIRSCDKVLFEEMMPNKALLLSPLPEDLLMKTPTEGDYSYSLLSDQDEFSGLISFKKNKYDDMLELYIEEAFGKKGLLFKSILSNVDSWSFGSVNTATLAETHFDNDTYDYVTEDVALKTSEDENFLGEYYVSSKPWICKYSLENQYDYLDLNNDIYSLMNRSDVSHKFAYCDPNMLEMFISDEDTNNICGELLNFNKVEINSHTVQESNVIYMEDEASIRKLDYISTGDQVIGKTIDDDTFVEHIDLDNHTVTLSKNLQTTGEFIFTFLCRIPYEPDDTSEDFYKYRIAASKNREVSNNSIFEHGSIDTQEYGMVSNHMLNSYVDFSAFRKSIMDNLREQPYYKTSFNNIVKNIYCKYLSSSKEEDIFVKPSMIESNNDIFFEINAHSLMGDDYIMRQEVLDYFEQYSDDLAKASDNVHLGVAINGYTLDDGKVTHNKSAYSDDNIRSRFITTEDWGSYDPYYVKIGSGYINGIFDNTFISQNDGDYESLGKSLYNDHSDPFGIVLYSGSENVDKSSRKTNHITDIAKPIFKARLGEYEIQKNIMFEDFSSDKVFNTIQFSIMRRLINSFTDNNVITIANDTVSTWGGLQSWPKNCLSSQIDGINYIIMGEDGKVASFKDISYLGEWIPRIENDSIVYPEPPIFDEIVCYYAITNDYNFTIDEKKVSFKPGQIIIWENGEWVTKTFYASGFIGNTSSASKYITNSDIEKIAINPTLPITEDSDLRTAIIKKILTNIGCYTNINSISNASYSELLKLYNIAMDFFGNKKSKKEIESAVAPFEFDFNCKNSFDESTCYWFQYVGYDDQVSDNLSGKNLNPGAFIVAYYYVDNFEFALCDTSKLLFNFDSSNNYIVSNEYKTLMGISSKALDDKYPFLWSEKIESLSTNIKLRDYDGLTEGSYSSINRIHIPYTTEGYKVSEDGTVSNVKETINLTEDYIYADDEKKRLFTYNFIDGKPEKFIIHQDQNIYYKNIINDIVKYDVEETLTKDGLIENGLFTAVSGFDFNSSQMSLNDRLLSIKPIDIRSAYNLYLEPRLYSKYSTLEGTLKGIISNVDTDQKALSDIIYGKSIKWNVSNEYSPDVQGYLNRSSFASSLNNFRPFDSKNDMSYQKDDLSFDKDTFNGKVVASPKVTKIDVLDKISTENGVIFYKNNLIVEGIIDENDSSTIRFGSVKSISALENVQIGDTIVDIASLTNGSNTFNQVELGLNGVRFIDYRYNKLLICTDSGMKVKSISDFTLESINKIAGSVTQNYTVDGLDLTGNVIPSMLIWDDDLEVWIIALKMANSEVGLGMYTVMFDKDDKIRLEKMDDSDNDIDINRFQLIDPYLSENIFKLNNSSEKLISNKYKGYKMLARDLAFKSLDENINGQTSRVTLTAPYIVNKDGSIYPKNDINEYSESPSSYIELDFTISKTNENSKLNLKQDKAYWIFDSKVGKWIFYSTNAGSEVYIGDQGEEDLKVKIYYVGYKASKQLGIDQTFETDSWGYSDYGELPDSTLVQGEFLWKLPRPVKEDELILVQVETEESYNQSHTTDSEGNDYSKINVWAQLVNAEANNISIITKDIINIGTDSLGEDFSQKTDIQSIHYSTGPYIPYEDNSKVVRGCSSSDGHAAVIVGNNIFVKSPTKLWSSSNNSHYTSSAQTSEMFWKKASLPKFRDISQGNISEMQISDAYLKVASMRKLVLDSLNSDEVGTYKAWLESHDVEYFSDIGVIPSQISITDVKYTTTSKGVRPTFYVKQELSGKLTTAGSNNKENYIVPEDSNLIIGPESDLYLREQMYLSYLKDFYEIILGCNSITNVFNDIKDVKMTDSSLIITSNDNIIMSISFNSLMSRDDIENMNNWNILSLDTDYEFPYCDNSQYLSNEGFTFSDNINGINIYKDGPNLSTFRAYNISCSYIKDDIQVYGGSLNLSHQSVRDYVAYIKEYNNTVSLANRIDYDWMDEDSLSYKDKYLFIAYSSNGGRSFTTVDLKAAGIGGSATEASDVDAIYRIDNYIRIIYHKGSSYFTYDIKINNNSLDESLITKAYEESDKDYKLMNKNFYIGGGYECLINSPNEANSYDKGISSFIISIPGSFAGGTITSVSSNSLTYNPNTTYDIDNGSSNVRILLAIKTSKQIRDQFKYLDFKEEYFNIQGDLRVPESTKVNNSSLADRAYSCNEILPIGNASPHSIPSIAVDTGPNGSHSIYKYQISFEPDSQDKVYNPIAMTNFEGNEIYLCGAEEGKKFLVYRNNLIGSSLSFKEVLNTYNDNPHCVSAFQKMYDTNSEYDFTVNDQFLRTIFEKYASNKSLFLKEIHFSNENPYIVNETTENTDDDISKIFSGNYFLKWPLLNGEIQTSLCNSLGLDLDTYDNSDDEGLGEFLGKLQLLEESLGNLTDDVIASYFRPIKVWYDEDHFFYGVYEVYSSTILMIERKVKETLSMTYGFNLGFNYLDNSTLDSLSLKDDNGTELFSAILNTSYDENSLINAISIDPKGYGSSISNDSWDCLLPQEIDQDAWKKDTLLYNLNGEPIFLCDDEGNNIVMRKGLFFAEKGNEYTISYDNLYADDSIVDVYSDNLISNKSSFHFYRLPESDIKIWVPFENVDFSEKNITLFKIYRGGVPLSLSDFNENYSITYSALYKENLSPYFGLSISYDGEWLTFNEKPSKVVVENDILRITVTDKRSGKSSYIDLKVGNCFKLNNQPETYISYAGEESMQVTYVLNKHISKISIPDQDISGSIELEKDSTKLTITISRLPEKRSILIYDENGFSDSLYLDIAELNPVLYTDRDWYSSSSSGFTLNNINCKVYSEDVDITTKYIITRVDNKIKASCKDSSLSVLTKSLLERDTEIYSNDFSYNGKFVYSYGESNTLRVNRQKSLLIKGICGQVVLLAPAYKNYKDLIKSLGRTIDSNFEDIYSYDDSQEKINIISIESNSIKIDHKLNISSPYLRIKLMPVATVTPASDIMNNSDYYSEVSIDDIDFFGYDRVYINEDVFMAPPLKIDNQYFNADSVSQYTVDSWINKDGYPVYLANNEGKYVKGFIANYKLNYKVIGDSYGNCSNEVYQSSNPRLNPTELIYKTSYDYYYDMFYSASSKSNPFFRFLKIKQNIVNGKIIDDIGIYQQIKENNKLILKKDDNFKASNSLIFKKELNEAILLDHIVNSENGSLNYTISCSSSNNEYDYMAGIKYKDYMYDSDIVSDKKYCKIDSDLVAGFSILSKEDLTNTKYKPIVDITEMGIFSKEGYLLAYMHHPIVQYNTLKNHISYNLVIENT